MVEVHLVERLQRNTKDSLIFKRVAIRAGVRKDNYGERQKGFTEEKGTEGVRVGTRSTQTIRAA